MLCDYGGTTHDAGPNCGNTYMQTETVCTSGGDGGTGGGDSGGGPGNPGGEPGVGSGGGGSSGGGSGGGSGGDDSGNNPGGPEAPPIITSPVVDDSTSNEQHCIKLKALSQNPSIGNAITAMAPKINLPDEHGYKFTKNGVALGALSLPQGDNNSINVPTGGIVFGAIHSHPNNGTVAPMFSAEDVYTLYNIAKNYNYALNNEVSGSMQSTFVYMLTSSNGTYAIKIDSSLFIAFMDGIMTNELSREKFFNDLEKKQRKSKVTDSDEDFEEDFLNFLSDYNLNISLFKTDLNNNNNWRKLEMSNDQVTPIPCN